MSMRQTYLIAGALCIVSVSAQGAGVETIICKEDKGGWCESSGECFENTKPPAEYRFTGIVPAEMGKQQAVLSECRETCGDEWQVEFTRGLDGQLMVKRTGEQFAIDLKTGFFSYASILSGADLGKVAFVFGHCRLPPQ